MTEYRILGIIACPKTYDAPCRALYRKEFGGLKKYRLFQIPIWLFLGFMIKSSHKEVYQSRAEVNFYWLDFVCIRIEVGSYN